jgi:hypothetical protein
LVLLGLLAFLFSSAAAPIQISGNLAFLPDQSGHLQVVNLATGTNPTVLATFPDLTDITGISLHGQYASVSSENEGLFVFDVSTGPPKLVSGGRFISIGSAEDVKLSGTTAFLADGDYGIVVIDLFDPGMPLELPSLFPPGIVYSLDIVSNRLYAACGPGGLLISDISEVSDAHPLSQRATASPARRVRVVGNHAYVLCEGGRLEIINIQNPATPTLTATYLTSGHLTDVDARGTFAVLANTNGIVTVLNLSNPAAPIVHSTHPVAGGAWGVRISGANAYVRNGAGELVVIPVSSLAPNAPQLQEGVSAQTVAAGQTAVLSVRVSGTAPLTYQWHRNGVLLNNNNRITGATNAWLVISNSLLADAGTFSVTVSNPFGQLVSSNVLTVVNPGAPIWRGGFNPGGSAESVDVNDFVVYVAAGANGLEVFNAINPRYPQPIGGNYVDGLAVGVRVTAGYTFVAAATNGLQVFNSSSFIESEFIAATNTPGTASAVHLAGGLAYVADGESGLQIFRLSDSEQPTFMGSYNTPGYAWNVFVADGIAYVADGTNGVQILSVTNPAAIIWLSTYDTPGEARNVKAFAGKAYVADGPGGLLVLNVANPASPSLLGTYPSAAPALDLDLVLNTVVLALGPNGVASVNVANPAAITALGTHPIGPAQSLRVEGNRLYVAAGTNGIQIFELLGLPITYPDVSVNPGEIISLPGAAVTFQAIATGPAPITYQWFKGGTPLFDDATTFGSGTATLTRSNLSLADSDEYFVFMRNGWNLPAFAMATLTVVPVGTPVFRSGHFNEEDSLNIHVVGQVAFIASRLGGLQAIDCRNPLQPVLVGQHPTLGLAQDVRVKGHHAYVATWNAGLEIFDITDPTNLVRVGHCPVPGFAHAIRLAGDYAHLANRGGGYSLVDIRDPAQPAVVGTAATGGIAEGLAVAGNHVYVAASQAGMEIFNIANPLAPVRVAQFDTPGNAEGIALAGNRAYISDYNRGIRIVDINHPDQPAGLGQFQTAGDAFQVQVVSNRAYIAEGIGKIEVVDISNASQSTRITTSLAGTSVRGLQIIGHHAFLADRENGFLVAELLGLPPSAPQIVEFSPSVAAITGRELILSVASEGTPPLSYRWLRNGVSLTNSATVTGVNQPHLSFPNLSAANEGNYTVVITNAHGSVTSVVATVTANAYGTPIVRNLLNPPNKATASVILGNVAYIADGAGGLRLVDLSNPGNPVALGTYLPAYTVFGVCLQTNLLYLALGSNGVAIMNVSNPQQPVLIGAFATPGTALNLDVANGRAFVAAGAAGLRIFNVTNPTAVTSLGFLATSGNTRNVRVVGDLAYVADGAGGLRIVNVTNPLVPVVIGSHISAGQANAVRLANNRAYVANGTAGLLILDVQNPAVPNELGTYPSSNATALDLVGNLVVLADGAAGYLVLDVTDPASVILIGSASEGDAISGALVLGNLAFLSSGTNGLHLVELFGVPPLAPVFLTQPTNTAVLHGGVARFEASPTGTPPLTYRWYHNGFPVFDDASRSGAATTRLTISNVAFANAGAYQLRLLSPAGVTNSAAAQLTFIGPLQAQLNNATNGAVINLAPGTYTETLVLDRDLTLTGSWWNQPVLSGGGVGPALRILPGATVTLRGLALRNGTNPAVGGGILNEGTLLLDRCLVADNAAGSGGGIGNLNTLHLFRCVISNNTATATGGGIYNGPNARAFITNSSLARNIAEEGGGLFNLGTNALIGSLVASNTAQGFLGTGGGIQLHAGELHLINCTLSGNLATSWSSQNGTALGGGLRADGGRLEFHFSTVANNTASFRGGGVSAGPLAEVRARNSLFADNNAPTAREYAGTLISDGHNLVQQTSFGLTISGTTTGNQLNVNARLGPLRDHGGPTLTHAPAADSPIIDAGAAPGPLTDARGIARPFDVPWLANAAAAGWDIGAMEYVDRSPYLIVSNQSAAGFTLAWATNGVLQKSASPDGGWLDQTNVSPWFVRTTNQQDYFRLRAPLIPILLNTNHETTNGFDLAWPDYGILERAPTTTGPWEPVTATGPVHINIIPGQNEFFRLRVIEH